MATFYLYGDNPASAAELASCAKASGSEAVLFAIGQADEPMLNVGADRVIVLAGASDRPEAYARPMADIVAKTDEAVFLAASTCAGRELAASIAGMLGCPMASDVSVLHAEGSHVAMSRTVYGGAVVQELSAEFPFVATVSAGAYEPSSCSDTAEAETLSVDADERVRRVSVSPSAAEGVDLTKADVVVCVGMGIEGEEDIAMAQRLASLLGGAVGCTRDVAEGLKLLPKERYIGITGAVVQPSLYLSMGVSGQLQHVYGIRDAKVVAAIDKNRDAPIFRNADYGIVGDLHEIVPRMIQILGAK